MTRTKEELMSVKLAISYTNPERQLEEVLKLLDGEKARADAAEALFDECALARDTIGYLGTVADCIKDTEAERVAAEATIVSLTEQLTEARDETLKELRAAISDWCYRQRSHPTPADIDLICRSVLAKFARATLSRLEKQEGEA